eukprot:Rmarinus@m.19073
MNGLPSNRLHAAASIGDHRMLKTLLRKGVDVDTRDADGKTALHYSIAAGNVPATLFLLTEGASLTVTDRHGWTAMHYAALKGITKLVEMLLDASDETMESLVDAEICTRRTLVKATDKRGRTPLHVAADEGHITVVKLLLAAGCNSSPVDGEGLTPLHLALRMGRRETSLILLGSGAFVVPSALSTANMEGKNVTPVTLHYPAYDGFLDVVEKLLSRGVPILSRDSCGRSAVHSAAAGGAVDVLRGLTDAGASVDEPAVVPLLGLEGHRPLHEAALNGRLAAAEWLLAHSANPNAATPKGETPLHFAASHGHAKVVRLLLSHPDTHVDAQDTLGRTALHHAAARQDLSCVRVLLAHGARLDVVDKETISPFHATVCLAPMESSLARVVKRRRIKLSLLEDSPDGGLSVPSATTAAEYGGIGVESGNGGDGNQADGPENGGLGGGSGNVRDQAPGVGGAGSGVLQILKCMREKLERESAMKKAAVGVSISVGGETNTTEKADNSASKTTESPQEGNVTEGDPPAKTMGAEETAVEDKGADVGSSSILTNLLRLRHSISGFTCLHSAVSVGSEPVVEWLLQLGSDPKMPDAKNRTPYHLAVELGHTSLLDLLRAGDVSSQPLAMAIGIIAASPIPDVDSDSSGSISVKKQRRKKPQQSADASESDSDDLDVQAEKEKLLKAYHKELEAKEEDKQQAKSRADTALKSKLQERARKKVALEERKRAAELAKLKAKQEEEAAALKKRMEEEAELARKAEEQEKELERQKLEAAFKLKLEEKRLEKQREIEAKRREFEESLKSQEKNLAEEEKDRLIKAFESEQAELEREHEETRLRQEITLKKKLEARAKAREKARKLRHDDDSKKELEALHEKQKQEEARLAEEAQRKIEQAKKEAETEAMEVAKSVVENDEEVAGIMMGLMDEDDSLMVPQRRRGSISLSDLLAEEPDLHHAVEAEIARMNRETPDLEDRSEDVKGMVLRVLVGLKKRAATVKQRGHPLVPQVALPSFAPSIELNLPMDGSARFDKDDQSVADTFRSFASSHHSARNISSSRPGSARRPATAGWSSRPSTAGARRVSTAIGGARPISPRGPSPNTRTFRDCVGGFIEQDLPAVDLEGIVELTPDQKQTLFQKIGQALQVFMDKLEDDDSTRAEAEHLLQQRQRQVERKQQELVDVKKKQQMALEQRLRNRRQSVMDMRQKSARRKRKSDVRRKSDLRLTADDADVSLPSELSASQDIHPLPIPDPTTGRIPEEDEGTMSS